MSLANLAVFNRWVRHLTTEILRENVNVFNSASQGTIVLTAAHLEGAFKDDIIFGLIPGLIRSRDPNSQATVSPKALANLVNTSVRVARGVGPVQMNPAWYEWIGQDPRAAAVALAQQLAPALLQDMLNVAAGSLVASCLDETDVLNDVSGASDGTQFPSWNGLNDTMAKFGDASMQVRAWLAHSTAMHRLWGANIANTNRLFEYGTVAVVSDPFGKPIIVSDCAALRLAGTPVKYRTLGLTASAAIVEQGDDWTENVETSNGEENIQRTYQAEWSFRLGLKGYTWDKGNGQAAPSNGALFTSTNWDRTATSHKDLGAVLYVTQ